MWKVFAAILHRVRAPQKDIVDRNADETADSSGDAIVALESKLRTLELEIDEREQLVADLRNQLTRRSDGEIARVKEMVQAQGEQFVARVATPVAQLLTQAHLLEVEGQPVQTKDVMSVALRLVRALEDFGLRYEGSVGEKVPFDPACQEPVGGGIPISPQALVTVRFVGVTYNGRILRKAGVEKAGT